jgi:hypothetical protein
MSTQKRKSRRRTLGYPAHIMSVDHVLVAKCRVEDISDNGMKITVEFPEAVPEEFILLFTGPRGGVTRVCRIVRRADDGIGVTYDREELVEAVKSVRQLSALSKRLKAATPKWA